MQTLFNMVWIYSQVYVHTLELQVIEVQLNFLHLTEARKFNYNQSKAFDPMNFKHQYKTSNSVSSKHQYKL